MRTVANARLLSGKVISMTPAPAPKVVSACVGPSRSIRRRPMVASAAGVAAATTPSALVSINRRPAVVAHGRQCTSEHLLRPRQRVGGKRMRLLQTLGGDIGDCVERDNHFVDGLPAVIEDLHGGADANGGEKRDDEHRNGAAQQGLGGQQAAIRRLGDRLRETLNRIRACRRTRHPGARH